MELRFDPVRAADGPELLALARAFHDEGGQSLDAAGEAAVLPIAAGEVLARGWILRRAGATAVGYLVLTIGYSIEYGGRDGFLDEIYLVPELRGQGLGRGVIAFALEQARLLGINTLHLEVEPGNAAADRLYRAVGFTETGRRLMRRRIVAA